ncbi:MAG: metallopeptidase family protein [Deltaproteobacteria bacterium]|nr:metallopeptidase family protein [Deltaproteobacteria bacterium]
MHRALAALLLAAACSRPAAPASSAPAVPPAPGAAASAPELRTQAERLLESGQAGEARALLSRALERDAGDPQTLLALARLLVERFGDDREALLAALEQAERGARAAFAGPRPDADLAAQLLLVGAMAANDLGRAPQALALAEEGLRSRPGDVDLRYERGVALYESCHFEEAERELGAVVQADPADAWALHYLALVAERSGERQRAERLSRRAARLAPAEFARAEPGPRDFRRMVEAALGQLGPEERKVLRGVAVGVEDLPALEDLTAGDPPLSPSILGLFRGPPLGEPCTAEDGPQCRSIVLYRKNLARLARDRAELKEQIRVTLLHEIGHLRGLDEDALRDEGLE